jgi:hypothetical protein
MDPVSEYSHAAGCAIIGGYVYRGSALPRLQGRYVFGDLCTGVISALDPSDGSVTPLMTVPTVHSFGEDADGELYILRPYNVSRITFFDCNGNGVRDELDVAGGGSDDCNADGVPDECEPDCNGNSIADECDIAGGGSTDLNNNGVPDECDEAADLDGDGIVGVGDLLILLGAWGPCPDPPAACPADLDGNGEADVGDLLLLLGTWTT